MLNSYYDTVPLAPEYYKMKPGEGDDMALEAIYIKNIQTLSAINHSRGVKTIFIAQMLNRAQLTSEKPYGWLPRVKDKDVWGLQERFNGLLKSESKKLGDSFIGPDIEEFNGEDFVDQGHFSERGSEKFANLISASIQRECR